MTEPHPLLVKAAQLVEQARAISEEYKDDPTRMPADVQETQGRLLAKASEFKAAVMREAQLQDLDSFLKEPEYKHDMTNGDTIARSFGHGGPLLESERKERQIKAFWAYVKGGMSALTTEMKADLVEDSTGEILVPTDYAGAIIGDLPRLGVIRPLAFVRPTTSNKVDTAVLTEGSIGWGKLETGTTAPDSTPSPASGQIEVFDLLGLAKVGVDELEDSPDNLSALIQELVSRQFAEEEDNKFAAGTGTAQPQGLTATTNSTPAAAGETPTADELTSIQYDVAEQYRRNGVYLAHSSVEAAVVLLKDGNQNYLWQPSVQAGVPASFRGKRWYTCDGLADMNATNDTAAGTNPSVIFGDIRAAYMIADRRRITVRRLDERYAETGKVGFLFTHRVGGGLIRNNAVVKYLL